jgi:transcriptional regulator with AAA-type ATPase domain
MSPSDRAFFADLADVVFGNPFSAHRENLIVRLAPDAPPGDLLADPDALPRVVNRKLEPFFGPSAIKRLSAEERAVIEPALLYVAYHRAVPQLDALTAAQEKQPGAQVPVTFADEVFADLARSGFPEERAARYLALFYQLRRGFRFILRGLAGESESMRGFREALWNNLFTHDMRGFDTALWNRMEDFSTLLLGETGTGKGSAAAAIGRSQFVPFLPEKRCFASSFAQGFIAINLSQYPESLIESELFGHRKGAFTGAIDHHEGVFERCDPHGALFLDEIGEVTVPVQIKLLQVLQERSFTPVGGHEAKRFAGRVIAATNRPLAELRREGRFRDDFFYRLCSDVIEVPTLRQRLAESPRELEQLVAPLVGKIAGEAASLAPRVLEALRRDVPRDYAWPGNVRELEQAVRRILLTGSYQPEAANAAAGDSEERLLERLRQGSLSADELLAQYCRLLHERLGSYAAVASRTGLDPRTTRKYILAAKP